MRRQYAHRAPVGALCEGSSMRLYIAQSVEPLYFTTELHTSAYGFESSQGQNIYMEKKKKKEKNVGMYVVWLSPSGRDGFAGISRECRDMSWLSATSGSPVHNTQQ